MTKNGNPIDGRRMRSVRTKQAIADACFDLIKSGQLVPTAQMIANQAGIPIRSFYRHFPDMESLFGSLDEAIKPRFQGVFMQDVFEGSLRERVRKAVELYCEVFSEMAPIIKAAKIVLWRYEALRIKHNKMVKVKREDMERRIPELKEVDYETRELVHAISSFEMWERLYEYQNVPATKIVEIIATSVEGQLRQASSK